MHRYVVVRFLCSCSVTGMGQRRIHGGAVGAIAPLDDQMVGFSINKCLLMGRQFTTNKRL